MTRPGRRICDIQLTCRMSMVKDPTETHPIIDLTTLSGTHAAGKVAKGSSRCRNQPMIPGAGDQAPVTDDIEVLEDEGGRSIQLEQTKDTAKC